MGLRTNRYSWWVHWREVADFELPRRYKWLITPNQASRGSPINQRILDSTGTIAARDLSAGMMSGVTNPSRPWFKLKIGQIDSTQTSPISIWLAECERRMMLVFHESNFYNAMGVMYSDLVVFGTAIVLVYEDFNDVIRCFNPCLGEFYVENNSAFRVVTFFREFTLTISQVVDQFGLENCSDAVKQLYRTGGAMLSREIVIGHAIYPNDGKWGIPSIFRFAEFYWEIGQAQSSTQQGSGVVLQKKGFWEAPFICVRWDLVSNDTYGRSPGMDALPDIKQLQQETKRKAQALDKMVNPPMVADVQLKNQPASLLPGGVTYVTGFASGKTPGFAPAYTVAPPVKDISEDLQEVRERIKKIFFNNLFQMAAQYEPRSNVTATEWDIRKSETMIMIGPVLERLYDEGIKPVIERTWGIMDRAGILPPPPPEIAGQPMTVEFVSMLSLAQAAAQTAGIERTLQIGGNLAGIDPAAVDNIDIDYAIEKYSTLMNNDPKLIRSPAELKAIRTQRQQQQAAEQAQQATLAGVQGAKVLSETEVGGGQNALQRMLGGT